MEEGDHAWSLFYVHVFDVGGGYPEKRLCLGDGFEDNALVDLAIVDDLSGHFLRVKDDPPSR